MGPCRQAEELEDFPRLPLWVLHKVFVEYDQVIVFLVLQVVCHLAGVPNHELLLLQFQVVASIFHLVKPVPPHRVIIWDAHVIPCEL